MRNILFFTAAFFLPTSLIIPQERFVSEEFAEYYAWFHEHSQAAQLYQDGATLYIFSENAQVYEGPCRQSRKVTTLGIGQPVTNHVSDEYYFPEDEINGYGDIWRQLSGRDKNGRTFNGYVWGADIAKSWQSAELTGEGKPELIMLGIASQPRIKARDIKAEIRILNGGRLLLQHIFPELCVFEDCAASSMLRVLHNEPAPGKLIIEASTMTVGCWAGIEKAFFYWDGQQLDRVYHAEYTTQTEYVRKSFLTTETNPEGATPTSLLCTYSHENENYNPVWNCKTIKSPQKKGAPKPDIALNDKTRAR